MKENQITTHNYVQLIKDSRRAMGLTGKAKRGEPRPIEVFADLLGVNDRTVERYEAGLCKPSRAVLMLLDKALKEFSEGKSA